MKRKWIFSSMVPLVFIGCAHSPEMSPTNGVQQSLNLPLTRVQVKEEPKPLVAPDTFEKPKARKVQGPAKVDPVKSSKRDRLVFDIPVAYNDRVAYWVEYFQTSGRTWFVKWLQRSHRFLPVIQKTLARHGLPKDLAYMSMIESGFSSQASSVAKAVGPWQFIRETGQRYGLKVTWWLDERRDFQKSTDAAARYMKKLYGMFHNWYLVAASYNTGENRVKRQIERHGTNNFWMMAHLENETKDYVPKLIAALLISRSPAMYGFHALNYDLPYEYELFHAPGGTRLDELAGAVGVSTRHMHDLNPELTRGYIPQYISGHVIRIPKGTYQLVSLYFRRTFVSER